MKHKVNLHLVLCILLLITASIKTTAQTNYKNIVLEGGGIRGFAYIGTYEVLDSLHILDSIERVGGSSAGAIQAALLAVGYTPSEMKVIAETIPLKKFTDGGWSVIGGSRRMHKQFGWYKGDAFATWIGELIAKKTGSPSTTFAELHANKTQKGYKDLYITGTDLTYQCLRIFSYEHYPNMSIRDAVRISMSIPFYYKPILIDDSGKVCSKTEQNKTIHVMVDGGVLSNYPIHMFDSTKYSAGFDSINVFYTNPATLGILLEHSDQIKYSVQNSGVAPVQIKKITQFYSALYFTLVDKPNPELAYANVTKRTISIDNLNLSPRVRKLDPEIVQSLINSGRVGALHFFKLN
ncbi:patatin-like phospholipase family protein [Cytophaga aurantiaca]|uniref:patatin-like phospholipase family protein n=1 Tax=Cytophaga aurantiaca TaxID=29530 RepID=UPI0003780CDC|nr:patatin-like phospholipase family protein [Cytophaga aurantiaca]